METGQRPEFAKLECFLGSQHSVAADFFLEVAEKVVVKVGECVPEVSGHNLGVGLRLHWCQYLAGDRQTNEQYQSKACVPVVQPELKQEGHCLPAYEGRDQQCVSCY